MTQGVPGKPALEMIVGLCLLFWRSRSFAVHVRNNFSAAGASCNFGGLIDCVAQYKLKHPEFTRFVLPAELANGRHQKLQTDLQGYKITDVVVTLTEWYTDRHAYM